MLSNQYRIETDPNYKYTLSKIHIDGCIEDERYQERQWILALDGSLVSSDHSTFHQEQHNIDIRKKEIQQKAYDRCLKKFLIDDPLKERLLKSYKKERLHLYLEAKEKEQTIILKHRLNKCKKYKRKKKSDKQPKPYHSERSKLYNKRTGLKVYNEYMSNYIN